MAFRDAGGELVALAPLSLRTIRHRRVLPVRRLELLCSGEARAEEICSDYIGVVCARDHIEGVARRLADMLAEGALGDFDELHFGSLSAEDPFVPALGAALAGRGMTAVTEPLVSCPLIPLPATWEDYLAQIGSKNRYLVTRSLRDLEAWAGKEKLVLRRAGNAAELAEGRRVLHALHAERWSASAHDGVFVGRRFVGFHDEIMPRLLEGHEDGRLDLLWLTAGDRALAVLYNLVYQGRVYFYQSGRTVDLPEKLRPGIAVHALAIRRAIEEGLTEYDFLSGEAQYKRQLAPATRGLLAMTAVGPSIRARVVDIARRRGEELARRLLAAWKQRRGSP